VPLALYLVGSTWYVAPDSDDADDADAGTRLSPCYELRGELSVVPSRVERGAGEVKRRLGAFPVCGLISLDTLRVFPDAVVPLSELHPSERVDVEKAYAETHQMALQLRAQLNGVSRPRLVTP
jgi:hypothetical protein